MPAMENVTNSLFATAQLAPLRVIVATLLDPATVPVQLVKLAPVSGVNVAPEAGTEVPVG